MYSVVFTDKALKELRKLDPYTASFILGWIRKNLHGCENPRRIGKGLVEDLGGSWCYRIGNYRLLAEIFDCNVTILVLTIGHRSQVYR